MKSLKAGQTIDAQGLMEELNKSKKDVNEKAEEIAEEPSKGLATYCPRCGWNIDQLLVEPSEEDKTGFLRYILGKSSFDKTYEMFGGKLLMTFGTKKPMELDLILDQLEIDEKKNRLTDGGSSLYFRRRYDAALSFRRMETVPDGSDKPEIFNNYEAFSLQKDEKTFKALVESLKERNPQLAKLIEEDDTVARVLHCTLLMVLPPPIYSAMFQISLDFDLLVDVLLSRANDRDFWSPVVNGN